MTARLTRRQQEVVRLLADGLTYAQTGRELGISAETVRVHVAKIAERFGARTPPLRWVLANASRLLAA